jgi:hypothetical protein
MPYFPIFDVTGATTDRPEALGTKEKFWLVPSATTGLVIRDYLFKIGRPQTGENWAEKVCCEILRNVEVPCANYEFAVHEGDAGVISQQFVPVNGRFVPANMLLETVVKEYWATIFSAIPQKVYQDIFARIDPKLISAEATQFALRMLHANSDTIKLAT